MEKAEKDELDMDVKEEDEDMEDEAENEDGHDDDGSHASPETGEIRELAHRLEKFG